ncbi:hypothetical protein JR316_0013048 [Psilocybe cubensis]|uniref:Uncharacterized protein n=1 Tax=Psilocybe cubensis TaxID=181762 RepID=A0ACB8GGB1_PSICU|nr:hypothetical protein JR316_0013048 [Psilocybe cubensis]KAH9474586.1 hypothetical protein JR316_0013048 [Psilocybe cubensis]
MESTRTFQLGSAKLAPQKVTDTQGGRVPKGWRSATLLAISFGLIDVPHKMGEGGAKGMEDQDVPFAKCQGLQVYLRLFAHRLDFSIRLSKDDKD